MAGDWLAADRIDVAAEKILDAAEGLFARHGAANVGMNDIAVASGCSRATLYRYFANRDALHTAYVHREARRVFREVGDQIHRTAGPGERLADGVIAALRQVRESPALSAWFAPTGWPIGGEMAERSEMITARTEAYLRTLGLEDSDDVAKRARWLLRIMISLLVFPGRDEVEERAILEEFVLPTVMPERLHATQ